MYGKKEATMTRGLAIITMVILHLFCRKGVDVYGTPLLWVNKETPFVYYFGFFCEICVPLYAMCAGYAQQVLLETNGDNHNSHWKNNLKRILKLMINYWIILVLFSILGTVLPSDGSMPGSIDKFLKSIVLIDNYNGAWWFLNTYIILMIIPSIILMLPVRKLKSSAGIIACIVFQFAYYVVGKMGYMDMIYFNNPVGRFIWKEILNLINVIPYFYIGAFLCKGKLIDEAKKIMDKHIQKGQNKFLFIVSIILFIGFSAMHKVVLVSIVAILVFLMFNLWKKNIFAEKVFLCLGKHSTNIWLIHMFFYLYVFPGLVQTVRYPVLMFAYMMVLCCLVSEIILFIHNKIITRISI